MAFLLLGAVGACKGGKAGKESGYDASVVAPPIDAGTPDAMVGDAGELDDSSQLPGSGHVAGGTVSMDVEVGNAIEPAVLKGGTYTLEITGDIAPSSR
jgi:hypothetical protein